MNAIPQLSSFYTKALDDDRLSARHISLYMAMFHLWNLNSFMNPVVVTRTKLMRISKISSFTTFHKCVRDLETFGYIRYEPSFNYYRGSYIYL
jgi:hypothetical protein